MPRPTEATIVLDALRSNLALARAHAPSSKCWAVVKANAYGHGLERVLPALAQADGLALIEFDQACRLRELGWKKRILMLEGAFDAADTAAARAHGLDLVVHCEEQLGWLADSPGDGPPVHTFAKFDSGLNRLGFDSASLRPAHARLSAMPAVRSVALMTHFANADLAGGADESMELFAAATVGLAGEVSLANSAAVLSVPTACRDWIRPGIMLYGGSPFAQHGAADLGLAATMVLRAGVLARRELQPGDAVGYGSLFRASEPMPIAVVACGYADGYPRHAPSGTPVLVDGMASTTLGRVAMDLMMIDLRQCPSAGVGSVVELWGDNLPIDAVAQSAGTIGYELMCALAPRVAVRVEALSAQSGAL